MGSVKLKGIANFIVVILIFITSWLNKTYLGLHEFNNKTKVSILLSLEQVNGKYNNQNDNHNYYYYP